MKFSLINVVRWAVNIAFFGYLLLIPIYWIMMLGEYFGTDFGHVMLTQIQHGNLLKSATDPNAALAAGKPFVLEETAATLWVKTDNLVDFILYSQIGDRNGFGLNFITLFFGFALVFLLKRIFDSIRKEGIFTPQNAKRIQFMGWVLIARYFYMVIISYRMNTFIEGLNLPYEFARGMNPTATDFHLGILLFCIGLVYREGIKLKKEAELVI